MDFNFLSKQPQTTCHMEAPVCLLSPSVISDSYDPMDCSPSGSSVHGILQARTLGWVAMPSSRGSSPPRDGTHIFYVSGFDRQALYH